MGRTRRKRSGNKRILLQDRNNLNKDENLINLQKWLKEHNWCNETKLKIMNFPATGRGIASTKALRKNDTLITVPYDLLITFTTIQTHFRENCITLDGMLTMQEFLTLFLMLERTNENSSWKAYINSLPSDPPDLPWLKPMEQINSYPGDLKITAKKNLENFETSCERVRKSIRKPLDCVCYEMLFKWAFVMVNTRAVYVDPHVVWGINNSLREFLSDEPSQALCPFLDMFNHDFQANSEAKLSQEDGGLFYGLQTLTSYKAYEQIMISYGPHDNQTLLMQYGFFIPGNIFDVVRYRLQEVIKVVDFNVDCKKYKFIKDHKFDRNLYIGHDGVSFNLKAFFYVIESVDMKRCNVDIFSDSYPLQFGKVVNQYACVLLNYKLRHDEEDFNKFLSASNGKCENKLMECYLRYNICFIKGLIDKYF